MKLSEARLRKALAGRPFRYFPTIASTNDEALTWLSEGATDGALVITDHQQSGRGRLGRAWFTPPASALTFTLILRCDAFAARQSTMLAAVAMHELLREFVAAEIGIKWPNDVQIAGRKVCGILPEAGWHGEQFNGVVLGVGLNTQVDFSGSPLAETAISLHEVSHLPIDRLELLRRLLAKLDAWRPFLGCAELFHAWRARLNMLGSTVQIGELRGIASGVDEYGALLLDMPDGRRERVLAGDLSEWSERR